MSNSPEEKTINLSAARSFLDKNREKIYVGAILYLFGVNSEQKIQLTEANARADKWETKYEDHREKEVIAANKIAFRSMLASDTLHAIGRDTVLSIPIHPIDSTKK